MTELAAITGILLLGVGFLLFLLLIQAKAEGAVLFFRMGDFYEIFGPDAEEIAPKMDVVLTSRERGDAERMPFCGVPHHSVKSYLLKLLSIV